MFYNLPCKGYLFSSINFFYVVKIEGVRKAKFNHLLRVTVRCLVCPKLLRKHRKFSFQLQNTAPVFVSKQSSCVCVPGGLTALLLAVLLSGTFLEGHFCLKLSVSTATQGSLGIGSDRKKIWSFSLCLDLFFYSLLGKKMFFVGLYQWNNMTHQFCVFFKLVWALNSPPICLSLFVWLV